MVTTKVHEIISLTRSKGLENFLYFNTQKRILARNDFEKNFYKILKN